MQLNAFTDYSLRVLVYAASQPEQQCVTADVAAAFGVSRNHMVKVVHALQRFGYVRTVRGRRGGFRLAAAPDRIRLGDVVRRTEGTLALVECFETGSACPLTRACGIKRALSNASSAFFEVLDRWTVADAIGEPQWAARVHRLHVRRKSA
ncbi:MAG: Rrf2 family transcriptional regulator [Acidobacteria bacterium]|nr:Rrf2 family transcriptional regulator [Acidobacteriota bacterium]